MKSCPSVGKKTSFLFFSDFVQHGVRRPLIAQKDVRRGYFYLQTHHRVRQSVLFWRFFFQSNKKISVFLGYSMVKFPKKSNFFLNRQILS
jgi:hypothetical protein